MKLKSVIIPVSLLARAACAGPAFEIVDKSGAPLFELREGFCFVGCNIKVQRADRTECSGFAPTIDSDTSAVVSIKCPDRPSEILTTAPLKMDAPTVGTLETKVQYQARNKAKLNELIKTTQ
ncbi:MAG: hypothetical protein OXC60_11610 [Litoreibacter sp.]|nr:hypothetical protein [Litoreibacter sp.]MCY4335299.1 hypothetical protein [Litoreibacter sp.]